MALRDEKGRFIKGNRGYWKGKKRPSPSEETRKKVSNALKGEKSYLWKGGKAGKELVLRKSLQYKLWREEVFKRDDYTCQICKERGGRLNADHTIPFYFMVKNPKYFKESQEECVASTEPYSWCIFDISLGRTLCEDCHRKTWSYGKGAYQIEKELVKVY